MRHQLRHEEIEAAPPLRNNGLEGIVGQCPAMQKLLSEVQLVAASDVPVLITGESGTGKELVARTIRALGSRADGPFVPVKCGAIPKGLMDGELFGLEQAAEPGPASGKLGRAGKGTLFLDEPSELAPQLQMRLLRLLQGKTLRSGTGEEGGFDTRIICATTKELASAVRAGEFLEDLYYRISVVTLDLPPLRERGEDIMLLAHLFLRRFAEAYGSQARGYSPAAVAALEGYAWPGNVRELQARIQRGAIMSDSPLLEPGALGFSETAVLGEDKRLTLREERDRVERKVICDALKESSGNLAKASEILDVSRSTLYDLLKKHGLFHAGSNGEASDRHRQGVVKRQ